MKTLLAAIALLIGTFPALGANNVKAYDSSHIVGHLPFAESAGEDKVIEIAKALIAKYPEFQKMSVRQDGPKTFGIDFTFQSGPNSDLKDFTRRVKAFVETKFGKDILTGWDVSNKILWIKQ